MRDIIVNAEGDVRDVEVGCGVVKRGQRLDVEGSLHGKDGTEHSMDSTKYEQLLQAPQSRRSMQLQLMSQDNALNTFIGYPETKARSSNCWTYAVRM